MSETPETPNDGETSAESPVAEDAQTSEKKDSSAQDAEAKESELNEAGENKVRIKPTTAGKKESSKKKRPAQGGYEELIKAGTIKRIMKIDKNVKMTGSEAVYLVSKATELFLGRIMQKAVSNHSTNPQVKSIHYNDVARTVRENSEMDFLVDLLPEV